MSVKGRQTAHNTQTNKYGKQVFRTLENKRRNAAQYGATPAGCGRPKAGKKKVKTHV